MRIALNVGFVEDVKRGGASAWIVERAARPLADGAGGRMAICKMSSRSGRAARVTFRRDRSEPFAASETYGPQKSVASAARSGVWAKQTEDAPASGLIDAHAVVDALTMLAQVPCCALSAHAS